jgi:hypothetical protein
VGAEQMNGRCVRWERWQWHKKRLLELCSGWCTPVLPSLASFHNGAGLSKQATSWLPVC